MSLITRDPNTHQRLLFARDDFREEFFSDKTLSLLEVLKGSMFENLLNIFYTTNSTGITFNYLPKNEFHFPPITHTPPNTHSASVSTRTVSIPRGKFMEWLLLELMILLPEKSSLEECMKIILAQPRDMRSMESVQDVYASFHSLVFLTKPEI